MLAQELKIQESTLKAWSQYWEISRHTAAMPAQDESKSCRAKRLEQYLKTSNFKERGICSALSCIAVILSNQGKLRDHYRPDLITYQVASQSFISPSVRYSQNCSGISI